MKYIKNHKIFVMSLIMLILGGSSFGYIVYANVETKIHEDRPYRVIQVLDGDTFKIQTDRGRVATIRMLGIDTPETVDPRKPEQCYGRQASDEVRKLLKNKFVTLKLNPDREVKDRYGRFLAYVYLEDSMFLNEYLITGGYAREYTYGKPYDFQERFRLLELEAKNLNKGLWSLCID